MLLLTVVATLLPLALGQQVVPEEELGNYLCPDTDVVRETVPGPCLTARFEHQTFENDPRMGCIDVIDKVDQSECKAAELLCCRAQLIHGIVPTFSDYDLPESSQCYNYVQGCFVDAEKFNANGGKHINTPAGPEPSESEEADSVAVHSPSTSGAAGPEMPLCTMISVGAFSIVGGVLWGLLGM